MNGKCIIIPDIHLRHEIAEEIISHEKPDKIIFLGDVFDDFGDTPQSIADTADWFRWSVNQTNRIHCCGNHDIHYWFKDNRNVRCSGYEQFKSSLINDIVKPTDWEKLVFFYNLDNKWLLSHAGVNPDWIVGLFDNITVTEDHEASRLERHTKLVNKLSEDTIYAKINFSHNNDHWFGQAGFSRSYKSNSRGGLLWCDWNDEFQPVKGIHQIVGHTPNPGITWKVLENNGDYMSHPLRKIENPTLLDTNSYNICLDSWPGNSYYGVYENGNLAIRNTMTKK